MAIAYICCTLPGRDLTKLKESAIHVTKDNIGYFEDNLVPVSLPTTTRYQKAYEYTKKMFGDAFDAYMFIGDDCEFTPMFQEDMLNGINEAIQITGDRRVCVYPDDGIHGARLATHPCFTKEWIEALGYFFPQGAMRHCFVDNYIMELGKKAGRIAYCQSAKLIHNNYFRDSSIPLDQYQQKVYSPDFYEEDKRRYEYLLKTQLDSDVARLIA